MDDKKLHLGFLGVDLLRSANVVGLFKTEATFEAVEAIVEAEVVAAIQREMSNDFVSFFKWHYRSKLKGY